MSNQTIYETITAKIIEQLEKGVVPWRKPWKADTQGNIFPKNFITKKAYRGCNTFLLGCQGYDSNYWLTFNQCKAQGGNVKKGEKSTPVIFWKMLEKEGQQNEKDFFPCLKYYNVFNVSQCQGLPKEAHEIPKETLFKPIEACENVLTSLPLGMSKITNGEDRAYYSPTRDFINMPNPTLFENEASYYSVLFHELTHATGHKSRLNREGVQGESRFGDSVYSKEELIAECGASFLCGFTGIETSTLENSASYISNWLSKLRSDNKLIIQASGQAQKAVDYLLNIKFEEKQIERDTL